MWKVKRREFSLKVDGKIFNQFLFDGQQAINEFIHWEICLAAAEIRTECERAKGEQQNKTGTLTKLAIIEPAVQPHNDNSILSVVLICFDIYFNE